MGQVLKLEDTTSGSKSIDSSFSSHASSEKSPLAPVLRSKGLVWVDTKLDDAFYWGHAGRSVRLQSWGSWGEEAAASAEDKGYAPSATWPPRTELVFIGAGMDEEAIRSSLDACLLSDDEFAALTKKVTGK